MTFDQGILIGEPMTKQRQLQQLQQQQGTSGPGAPPVVEVRLCVPEDQKRYLPRRATLPAQLGAHDCPRLGDVVQLNSSTTWAVSMVVHAWPSPTHHLIEVWIERVLGHMYERPPGFALTQ